MTGPNHPAARAAREATEAEDRLIAADHRADAAAAVRRGAWLELERAERSVCELAEAEGEAVRVTREASAFIDDPDGRRASLRAKATHVEVRQALVAAQRRSAEAHAELRRAEDTFERARLARQHAKAELASAERVLYGGLA